MKRCLIVAVLALAMLALSAPARDEAMPELDARTLATGEATFARQMYDQLRTTEGNVFFSPYSIQSALAMTMAGAIGQTAIEMHEALSLPVIPVDAQTDLGTQLGDLPWPQDRVHVAVGWLTKQIEQAGQQKGIDITIANSIWPAAAFEMRDSFVTTLKQSYGVAVTPVGYPDPGREKINTWVEGKTNNLIKDLLKPGMVDVDTQLVLVNAIYFKGNWQHAFHAQSTRDQAFHLAVGKQVNVPTMYQAGDFKYFDDAAQQVLELPYIGDALSMVIVLPKKVGGLAAVEKDLDLQAIGEKLAKVRPKEVNVYLPKFKYEYEKSLNESLQALGMKLAFTGAADFAAMAPNGDDVYISLVQHKAFIEVNETGSEAAAATAVVVLTESAVVREPPPTFRADRPFVFYIRHVETGAILFMGRVNDPRR